MGAVDRQLVQRLMDEIAVFNVEATGIDDALEFLKTRVGADGELIAGIYGWTWGGTCWLEVLWVRAAARGRGLGSEMLAAAESEARIRRCTQLALTTHTFQAPDFYLRHGFAVVGRLPDYPHGHADLMLRKPLV
jgi:GNAT superfamily N-acetyltransferase